MTHRRNSEGLRECECPIPNPDTNPRRQGKCVRCGFVINPEWVSCDATIGEFFDRLAEYPGLGNILRFRRQCEEREHAGRGLYGHRHLARDAVGEGLEEAADGANYAHFLILESRRAGVEEPTSAAFEAAWHFARAHAALLRARHPED